MPTPARIRQADLTRAVRDEDGVPIKDGDHITFTFGIPPICVLARLTTTGGDLWIECLSPPDVKPKREKLADLMRWYQVWKADPRRVAAALKDFGKEGA